MTQSRRGPPDSSEIADRFSAHAFCRENSIPAAGSLSISRRPLRLLEKGRISLALPEDPHIDKTGEVAERIGLRRVAVVKMLLKWRQPWPVPRRFGSELRPAGFKIISLHSVPRSIHSSGSQPVIEDESFPSVDCLDHFFGQWDDADRRWRFGTLPKMGLCSTPSKQARPFLPISFSATDLSISKCHS
jgi:hypothetical protein